MIRSRSWASIVDLDRLNDWEKNLNYSLMLSNTKLSPSHVALISDHPNFAYNIHGITVPPALIFLFVIFGFVCPAF